MMTDYIAREALKSEVVKRLGISERKYLLPAEKAIWDVICAIPAADVAPMVRGEWILKTYDDGHYQYDVYVCSKCGCESARRRNFCPDCGVDMRGNGSK